jgi:hypothetical protein
MLSFSEFVFILEELNDIEKKEVGSWLKKMGGKRADLSPHLPFDSKQRLELPFTAKSSEIKLPERVVSHLQSKGYRPVSPSLASHKNTPQRQIKIGKVVSDDPEVAKEYTQHGAKAGTKTDPDKFKIVISKHPHDVVGMSTRRGWTSCMNFEKVNNVALGTKREYLENDVKHGTHVAYLTHKDDDDIQKPIARIALKPFVGESGHTILHPEPYVYGGAPEGFHEEVTKWAKKHFPMKDAVYTKHADVYDDSDIGDQTKPKEKIYNPDISDDDMHRLITHPDHYSRLVKSQHIKPEHLETLLQSSDTKMKVAALRHPLMPKKHLDAAIKNIGSSEMRNAVLQNPSVSDEHIQIGMKDFLSDVRLNAKKALQRKQNPQ